MTEIIAVVNQKGGVGKTTTSINLAACLAGHNKQTLIIDADSQGNCTSGLGISKQNLNNNFYHLLMMGVPLDEVVMETSVQDLHIIPANRDLLGIENELITIENKELHLRNLLRSQLKDENGKDKYDFVIIDSPPNLSILSINLMTAATRLLIPMQPEYLPLEGLADLVDTYKRIRETLNPDLSILGVLITMYSSTNNLSKEVTQHLREHMGKLVLETVIPKNVKVAEAPSFCQPVIAYDPKSAGSQSYQAVTCEILNIINSR